MAGAVALVLLLVGVAVLELANFVADQFARATWLGAVSAVALAPAAFVLAWPVVREWRGYTSLTEIDAVRRGLASQDVETARRHADGWMVAIGVPAEGPRPG